MVNKPSNGFSLRVLIGHEPLKGDYSLKEILGLGRREITGLRMLLSSLPEHPPLNCYPSLTALEVLHVAGTYLLQ